jgi:hypothetical protein
LGAELRQQEWSEIGAQHPTRTPRYDSEAILTDGRLFVPKNISRLTVPVMADRFHLLGRR